MAKQTFTTGQVLTAAQMTSLQQTAMGGGSTTAKTASYVLVAADAGTVVQMNSASATTITVNTALFAAGDTVQIQNVGTGVCTVTAGTATVNTSSTLALKQYDAGSLYFNTTGAAIFFAADAADGASPLTTKGDVFTFSTVDARLGVGANNTVLTADSTQATGLKWATPTTAAKSYALLNAGGTALTAAATITVSGLSGYDNLVVVVTDASSASASSTIRLRFNTDTGANYVVAGPNLVWTSTYAPGNFSRFGALTYTSIEIGQTSTNAASDLSGSLLMFGSNNTGGKSFTSTWGSNDAGGNSNAANSLNGLYMGTSVISSVSIISGTGNFDAGRIYIYGAV